MKSRTLLIAAAALVLAGCGSSAGTGNAGPGSNNGGGGSDKVAAARANPCILLTQQEAQAAFGGQLDAGKANLDPVPGCDWPTSASSNFADGVVVQIQDTSVFDGTKIGASQAGFALQPVSGIGDEAFVQMPQNSTDPNALILLGFKKDGVAVYVTVTNHSFTQDQVIAAEKQLAGLAASRI